MNIFEWFKMINNMDLSVFEKIGDCASIAAGLVFFILYSYQFFYLIVGWFKKPLTYPETDKTNRYAVLIAARNESKVLPGLLNSLAGQTYPAENIDVYVVADNCTDNTADIAREAGVNVIERENKQLVGKGYALQTLLKHIEEQKGGFREYDGYMVFDADNILRSNYIEEMDKAHCAGYKVLTSYRNSKNYGKNWISAGYALWFMRESRHLNNPRSILGTSAAISGTGFMVDAEIIERNGGWKHFLLTEDIEFTVDSVTHDEKIGYCHHAELFDEQPETFRQSWRQRLRWAKGFFQVFHNYGKKLAGGASRFRWAYYDMIMNIMPAFLLSIAQLTTVTVMLVLHLIFCGELSLPLLVCYAGFLGMGYGVFFLFGMLAAISERKKIHAPAFKVIFHLFTFPLFMLTYIPISIAAIFSHVEWVPIEHTHNMMSTEDLDK